MKALVTGATGFVGSRLLARLENPVVLTRASARGQILSGMRTVAWSPQSGPPPLEAFDGIEAIFHLAGEPVASGRWTKAKKARIRDSRIVGTRNLVEGLKRLPTKPRVLVCASAVGYYGSRGDEVLTEQSSPGRDFLADVCQGWEREATAVRESGIRVVPIRIGIVLGPGGGALARMLTPFKFGLGSPLGGGRQYMPWVHLDDLVELMLFAARHDALDESLNGTAPNPVTNREFTKTLARVLSRPAFLPPVPGFVLKVGLGQFAEVLLGSQRALPEATLRAGFHFQYPTLEPALRAVLGR